MTKSFSIVINTLNRASHLRVALQSLYHLRHPKFEVIVVNGPSTDNSEEVIAAYADRLIHEKCAEANLSMSRNIGIRAAQGDIVCFMDDDATPEPDWLNALEEVYSDPAVGAVGGYTRDHTGYTFQARQLLCDRLGDGFDFEDDEAAAAALETSENTLYLSQTGTNSSFRRDVLLEIGGFDEHFVYFLDETDVNWRVLQAGYDVRYAPNAEVHHKYAPSSVRDHDRVPRSLYYPARSKAYFAIRNAVPEYSLHEVLSHLALYERRLRDDNRWYLLNEVIDQEKQDALNLDVSRGLRDGINAAMRTGRRVLISAEEPSQPKDQPFKTFPPSLPAEQRLKLCMLSQSYPPSGQSGIAIWTQTMAVELARQGHEVSVVTRGHDHPTVDYEDGVWVHRIPPRWQPTRNEPPLPDLPPNIKDYCYTMLDEVRRIRDRRGLDVVSAPIWDVEGAACWAAGDIPFVLSLHTSFKLALPSKPDWLNNRSYLKNHVNKIIDTETELLKNAPAILANSNTIIQDMDKSYGLDLANDPRLAMVYHGMLDMPQHKYWNEVLREGSDVRVLFVGRHEPRKGFPELLEAIAQVAPRLTNARFVLVGDDQIKVGNSTLLDAFKKTHKDAEWLSHVELRGEISREELWAEYEACDLFVAPSRYESFGLIFLEAMMFGKACIGAAVGGAQEVVIDGETGLLVESNNAADLAAALERLITDDKLRAHLGQAGRARFADMFTAEAMATAALDIYRKAANQQTVAGDMLIASHKA